MWTSSRKMAHHILSGPRGQLGGVPHDAAGGSLSQPRGDEAVLFEAEVAMSPFLARTAMLDRSSRLSINFRVILDVTTPRLHPLNGRIKLRHLVSFLEVARLKSVVKAAALLGLSQPAVSKTVQELEDMLGATLFEPNRRPMMLTGPGEVFFRYAGASLTALKQGVSMVGDDGANTDIAFSVGALPTVSAHVLPRALAEVMTRYGAMRPRVVTGPNDVLMSQLRLGDLDLVIGRMPDPETMRASPSSIFIPSGSRWWSGRTTRFWQRRLSTWRVSLGISGCCRRRDR